MDYFHLRTERNQSAPSPKLLARRHGFLTQLAAFGQNLETGCRHMKQRDFSTPQVSPAARAIARSGQQSPARSLCFAAGGRRQPAMRSPHDEEGHESHPQNGSLPEGSVVQEAGWRMRPILV